MEDGENPSNEPPSSILHPPSSASDPSALPSSDRLYSAHYACTHCQIGFEPPSRVPMLHEVLTIQSVYQWDDRLVALYFEEFPFGWNVKCFRPLVDDANDSEVEAEIYRRKVHQNGAPVKELERT